MKNKKGFTLVELLAVIAILAILVIIALPNVMGMFNDAKKSSFTTECKRIYKVAEQAFMNDSLYEQTEREYAKCDECTQKQLDLSGRDNIDYYIKFNKGGKVVKFYVSDGDYQYEYDGEDLLIENIDGIQTVAELNEDEIINIDDTAVVKAAYLKTGKEFNTTIKQLASNSTSVNYESTNSTIKHFVWANELDTTANSVEVNTSVSKYKVYVWFNTNTIYMYSPVSKIYLNPDSSSMFYNLKGILDIDLSHFDTSLSTTMKDMFWVCENLKNLDLSNFDTSKVTDMFNMFSSCYKLERLDLSNFDTSNVTSMGCMFWGCYVMSEVNVSSFNTAKVKEFGSMFSRCYKLTSLDLTSFSNESAENISAFFYQDSKLATVYVNSSWNVTGVSGYNTVFNQSLVKSFTVVNN